jgi:two-component sensor histidine kinase
MVELAVADDGVGLPKPGSCRSAAGIGLRLVQTLAQQLDGTLSCANRNGACFSLSVPLGNG